MTKYQALPALAALLLAPIFLYLFFEQNTEAETCCPPPPRPAMVPRYPQNTSVTVYIDTTGLNTSSGFSDLEKQAVKDGIESWNGQPNNSGVTFSVQETNNPPTLPSKAHVVVVQYVDQQNAAAIADTQTFSSGEFVSNRIRFFQNIRNVFNIPQNQPPFVRTVTRHEGGHTLGLGDADDCGPGTTIMKLGSGAEEFITPCDNDIVASQTSVYPSPSPTPVPESGQFDCNDGIDNDNNGLTDCEESACNHWCISGCSQAQWAVCWDLGAPQCVNGQCYTPIVIDTLGNGIKLTRAEEGVRFNVINTRSVRLAWTTSDSDDAWLALDRNNNGAIDGGEELFGNSTPQPVPPTGVEKNGFRALAEYDKPASGGNGDGVISPSDAIFGSLLLWQDTNHNGLSESGELHPLAEFGLTTLELRYKESKRVDEYGNQFRYRAKVKDDHGNQVGRWAWDVFLKMLP